jgi:AraC-like DNA-binding protein
MLYTFDERPSESPFIEKIWHTQSDRSGLFISSASTHSELVVTRYQGKTMVTVRGPETVATSDDVESSDAEFFGIVFKLGVFMPHLLPKNLMDRRDVYLPESTGHSFSLQGASWEIPTFENADTFINRLIHDGLLVRDDLVADALQHDEMPAMSVRHLRRRFLQSTGLTHGMIRQIDRAKEAVALLEQGMPILDVVFETGYFDQPHLTRSLKRFYGQTPAQIIAATQALLIPG